jgi:hypothetical protein
MKPCVHSCESYRDRVTVNDGWTVSNDSIRFIYNLYTVGITRGLEFKYSCCLIRSHTVSNGLVRSLIRLYTDMTFVPVFLSFKNHTRLTRIDSNGLSVIRITLQLVRLHLWFTGWPSISRVFCWRRL